MVQGEAFLISIGLEMPVALLLGHFIGARGWAIMPFGVAAVLGTGLTHPVVWHGALALYPQIGVVATLAVVEAFAVMGETIIYRALAVRRLVQALLVSFGANLVSFAIGLVL